MENECLQYFEGKLKRFGSVSFKKMFGGCGIYINKAFIGMIIHEELYFKVDQDTIDIYKQYNSEQFCYTNPNSGKSMMLNWWKVVDDILEDEKILKICYEGAFKAAQEVNKKKKTKLSVS